MSNNYLISNDLTYLVTNKRRLIIYDIEAIRLKRNTRSKGKVLEQTSCPNCPSSDAFTVYEQSDGSLDATCFSCEYYTKDPYKEHNHKDSASTKPERLTTDNFSDTHDSHHPLEECLEHPIRELKHRGISLSTCEHFGVRVGVSTTDGTTPEYHLYPIYDKQDTLKGFKKRTVKEKKFSTIGKITASDLFGSNTLKNKGSKLFITEGELDAMSVYQSLKENSNIDWDPSVISLPLGCGSAVKSITENLDRIDSYEQVILVLDQDEPGRKATEEVCKILAGKVYVAKLSEKDPNEMLMKGKSVDLKWAVLTNARKYQPDGILNAKDCWERYKNSDNNYYPYPDSMPLLNKKMYGARPGSLITITSGSGCGKTQFMRELKYHYWATTDMSIADIALEEDVGDTIGGLLSLHMNQRITLPDVKVDPKKEKEAFDDVFGSGRFTLYDFFGGMDDDNLFSKLRYFISSGNKLIFLDHLSIIVSQYAADGGERERIDTIMTNLAKIVKETGATIFLVVHLKKSESSRSATFEQGATPSLDDLRGSGSIKQLSWDVIGLSRNQQHTDARCANTSLLHVLKCRSTGRTGQADYLYFDDNTGRMIQSMKPSGY